MREYIEHVLHNLDAGSRTPPFTVLIASLDEAYRAIIASPPKGQLVFARFMLICHKSMLGAATLIAQRQPEDAAGISRRAAECARVALAVKLNPSNADKWVSFQSRHDRWIKRREGGKPTYFPVRLVDLSGEPLSAELDKWIGVLSDALVHFTPEFYDSLDWEERIGSGDGGEIRLNYFHNKDREIERSVVGLAALHGTILKVFDRCFDHGISKNPESLAVVERFWANAKRFSDEYQRRYGVDHSPVPPPSVDTPAET